MNKDTVEKRVRKAVETTLRNVGRIKAMAERFGVRIDDKLNENIREAIRKQFIDQYSIYGEWGYNRDQESYVVEKICSDIRLTKQRLLSDLRIAQFFSNKVRLSASGSYRSAWQFIFGTPLDETKIVGRYQNRRIDISLTPDERKTLWDLYYHRNPETDIVLKAIRNHFPGLVCSGKEDSWWVRDLMNKLSHEHGLKFNFAEVNQDYLALELSKKQEAPKNYEIRVLSNGKTIPVSQLSKEEQDDVDRQLRVVSKIAELCDPFTDDELEGVATQ